MNAVRTRPRQRILSGVASLDEPCRRTGRTLDARDEAGDEAPAGGGVAALFLALGIRPGGDFPEMIRQASRTIAGAAAEVAPPRPGRGTSRGRGAAVATEVDARNVRLYLTSQIMGTGVTELGALEVPPITPPTACRAISRGEELVRVARSSPGSRLNPDHPPARVERRRGASPAW